MTQTVLIKLKSDIEDLKAMADDLNLKIEVLEEIASGAEPDVEESDEKENIVNMLRSSL